MVRHVSVFKYGKGLECPEDEGKMLLLSDGNYLPIEIGVT
jgi:hypothetical protein